MPKRLILYISVCFLCYAPLCFAQATNGTYTLLQETISSAGGLTTTSGSFSADSCVGLPASGKSENSTFIFTDGHGNLTAGPIPTQPFTVTGTVDASTTSVTVNGIAGAITGTTFSAAGVVLTAGPNTLTAVASDAAGNQASVSAHVYLDIPAQQKTPRFITAVRGLVGGDTASVTVNGTAATITAGNYFANVLLTNGVNTITSFAADTTGNQTTSYIRVYVPLPMQIPPMPTVGTVGYAMPEVTTATSLTIGGTKTKGTSIWINGVEVVANNDQLTWSISRSLVEGDNELTIVAKRADGFTSVEVKRNIIVDNQPPVITFAPGFPPAKTNLNPFPFEGSVDDSKTSILVNGTTKVLSAREFTVDVPLAFGQNTIQITATSPNGLVTGPQNYSITLGHVPSILSVSPSAAQKAYLGNALNFSASASDAEQDPIQYRLLINGAALTNWGSVTTLPWTPANSQLGFQQISVEVKDDFGGSNKWDIETFVIHAPVQHP